MFGPSLWERKTKFYNNCIANSISLCLNSYLLVIVIVWSSKAMQSYKKVLISCILSDLFMAFVVICFQTTIFVFEGNYFMVSEGFFTGLKEPLTSIASSVHVFALYQCLASVPPQYIYRFLLVCRNKELTNCQFFNLYFWCTFFAFIYACNWCSIFVNSHSNFEDLNSLFNNTDWRNPIDGRIPFYAVTPLSSMSEIPMFSSSFLIMAYAIIIVCSILIYVKMNKVKNTLSKKTQDLQKQMTRVLMIQALIPFIIIGLPLIIEIMGVLFLITFPGAGVVFMFLTSWGPVINPIMILAFFEHYRKITKNIFRKVLRQNPSITISATYSITKVQSRSTN